ncbi:hypothetical protein JCM3770_004800 [Rhodotorula araucariae]
MEPAGSAPTEHVAPTPTSGPAVETSQRQNADIDTRSSSATAPATTAEAAVETSGRRETGVDSHSHAHSSNAESPAAGSHAQGPGATGAGAGEGESLATEPEGGYPEQTHAGKLGYGPHAPTGGGIADRLKAKEEIFKGKLKHDDALLQQGYDRESGLLAERRRAYDAEQDTGAFNKPADDGKGAATAGDKGAKAA